MKPAEFGLKGLPVVRSPLLGRPYDSPMAEITVYTTPNELCQRITRVFDARGFDYSLVKLETPEELDELTVRSGRKTCPVVYVGDDLIGGQRETLDAVNSGRIAELLGSSRH